MQERKAGTQVSKNIFEEEPLALHAKTWQMNVGMK